MQTLVIILFYSACETKYDKNRPDLSVCRDNIENDD